jgi:hypothetical protein
VIEGGLAGGFQPRDGIPPQNLEFMSYIFRQKSFRRISKNIYNHVVMKDLIVGQSRHSSKIGKNWN